MWWEFVYGRFISSLIRERFLESAAKLQEAELERFLGVCAFVDVSGFTKLAEHLVNKYGNDEGAELLNRYVSGYFEALVGVLDQYGALTDV